MAAPENDASRERRLRRTVTELSECTIDDIEAIWSALSHDEREQLRPLLTDAARVTPGNLAAAGFADTLMSPSGEIAGDGNSPQFTQPRFIQHVARLGESLPDELLARLIFSLDDRTRNVVIEALPAERRALLVREGHASRITERARIALLSAVSAMSAQSVDSPDTQSEKLPVERLTLSAKMRRWIGRTA